MFFLCFNRKQPARPLGIDPQKIINRLMPCAPPDKSGFLCDGDNSLLVQCLHWNTSRSRLEPAPLHHAESGIHAASWARLDNREELGKKLDIAPAELAGICETELILYSYLKWGESCVEHLIGDFVFVIHDRKQQKVFCGRDHMGVKPLYYFASDELFVCATSLAALRQLTWVSLEVDPKWVTEYLLHLSMSFDRTPYLGVNKLPPAHSLTVTPKVVSLSRYFTLAAEPELKLKDSRDYVSAYRAQLEEAIRCRLDSEYSVGSELSGGIDSSTVTAFTATLMDQPQTRLHTFSYAFSELEPEYIMAVTQGCHLHNSHIFSDRELKLRTLIPHSITLLGCPVEHNTAPGHEPFYLAAEQLGIRTLLSGFGGDEFSTTIHSHMVLLELAVQRRYVELYDFMAGNPLFRLLKLLKMEWRRRSTANFTTPLYSPRMYEAFQRRWNHLVVRDEMLKKFNLKERYFEDARFDAGYSDLKKFTLEKRWHPFIPTRLENCTLMAAGRGIDYRWPLLDIRLIRLFLAIPSEENYYRGMGRYLHRRAIDDVVPKKVTWKQGKNMGDMQRHFQNDALNMINHELDEFHPDLANFVDMRQLRQQIEQLPAISADSSDNRRFFYKTNILSSMHLSAWFRYMDKVKRGEL